jgi:hypothetical protein
MSKKVIVLIGVIFAAIASISAQKYTHSEQAHINHLDTIIIERAQLLGKNPNTYRLYIRTDADGAQIFRQLRKYIIINPNQELIYIHDKKQEKNNYLR